MKSPSLLKFLQKAYRQPQLQSNGSVPTSGCVEIDDKSAKDVYPGFCHLFVTVQNPESDDFTLELVNPPYNPALCQLVTRLGGQRSERDGHITIRLSPSRTDDIHQLAQAIRQVTARGQRYPDPNWKWIARRTQSSLNRFAKHLTRLNKAV